MSVASTWLRLDSKREKEIYGRLWLFLLECVLISPQKLQNEHVHVWTHKQTDTNLMILTLLPLRCPFSFSVSSVCQVKCSHSYVTSVVWLWHLTVTKGILTLILPMNPTSHTAKIWSGLSKCWNITGIPEEMCSGPQFNQEKAAVGSDMSS